MPNPFITGNSTGICLRLAAAAIGAGAVISIARGPADAPPVTLHPLLAADVFDLLDVESFPELGAAREAAAAGDQKKAKQALLDYMRGRTMPRWNLDPARGRSAIVEALRSEADYGAQARDDLEHRFTFHGVACDVGDPIDWTASAPGSSRCPGLSARSAPDEALSWMHSLHRLDWLPRLAQAALVTDETAFSDEALDAVWLQWARDNLLPPEIPARGPWRPLEAAHRAIAMLRTYTLLLHSESMTPERHFSALRSLVEHAVFLDAVNRRTYQPGNYGQAYTAALTLLGTMLPEFRSSLLPARGYAPPRRYSGARQWLGLGLRRLVEHLETGGTTWNGPAGPDVSPEGWSSEYAADYHQVGTRMVALAVQVADINAATPALSVHRTTVARMRSRVAAMFDVLCRYQSPDGMVYSAGDTVVRSGREVLGIGAAIYGNALWKAWSGRPRVLDVGTEALLRYTSIATLAAPQTSFSDARAGFVVLRPDATDGEAAPGSQMLFFDLNATALPVHAHHDAGQLAMFAFGVHMLVDPGRRSPYVDGDPRVLAPHHNVSRPDRLVADALSRPAQAERERVRVLPGMFLEGTGFDYADVLLEMEGATIERRVLYVHPAFGGEGLELAGFVLVSDAYTGIDATSEPATTYWHLHASAREQAARGASPFDPGLAVSAGRAARANFRGGRDGSQSPNAILHLLPLRHEEIDGLDLLAGLQAGIGAHAHYTLEGTRLAYRFDASTHPVRDQVLLPLPGAWEELQPEVEALPLGGTGPRDAIALRLAIHDARGQVRQEDLVAASYRGATHVDFGPYSTDGRFAMVRSAPGLRVLVLSGGTTLAELHQQGRVLLGVEPGDSSVEVVERAGENRIEIRRSGTRAQRLIIATVKEAVHVLCNGHAPAWFRWTSGVLETQC